MLDVLKNILSELSRLTPPPALDIPFNVSQTTVTVATPVKPQDPNVIANAAAGTPGYDIIHVYTVKKKLSNKIFLINDGPGTLFAVCSPDGQNFTGEGDILVHEFRAFTQVWGLWVRSPDGTTKFRITEYEPGSLV